MTLCEAVWLTLIPFTGHSRTLSLYRSLLSMYSKCILLLSYRISPGATRGHRARGEARAGRRPASAAAAAAALRAEAGR